MDPAGVKKENFCELTPTGFGPTNATTDDGSKLGNPPPTGAAQSGAVYADPAPCDPDLARLIDAWPLLPFHVKTAMMALAAVAKRPRVQ
jgi:hypothetical protein